METESEQEKNERWKQDRIHTAKTTDGGAECAKKYLNQARELGKVNISPEEEKEILNEPIWDLQI